MSCVCRATRGGWPVRLVVALSALLSLALATPAGAAACPQWSKVKAFRGTANTVFSGTATGSDNNGGTVTVELNRSGSVNVDLAGRIPKSGSSATEFLGGTGGGTLLVHDTYSDVGGGQTTSGGQMGDGPGATAALSNLAFMTLNPSSCTYQLHISFAVVTTSTGDWPTPPDPGAGGFAVMPARRIPSNLKLVGTAEVPAYYDGCSGSQPPGGCYEFGGFEGGYAWAEEFDMLKNCGSVVAASCGPSDQQEGTATVSWSMSANPAPKKTHRHHKKPHHHNKHHKKQRHKKKHHK
jgi:hypothetical protein